MVEFFIIEWFPLIVWFALLVIDDNDGKVRPNLFFDDVVVVVVDVLVDDDELGPDEDPVDIWLLILVARQKQTRLIMLQILI